MAFEACIHRIVGTAYYDATDWNIIRFNADGVSWLINDGELAPVFD